MSETKCKTGWIFSEHYLWHDTGRSNLLVPPSLTVQPGEHAENEETKRRFANLLEVSLLADKLVRIKPRAATEEELLRVHTQAHIDGVRDFCAAGGGMVPGDATAMGPASFDIAKLAVGGVLAAVDAVLAGTVNNAYVLCRPPGHHAEPEKVTGFCLFANGALGVEHARQVHGFNRVAVIDYDVHHGNSCETIFYHDPDVLTISLHQDNLFPPDRGYASETGGPGAEGTNINIPLPPGSGGSAYAGAFDQIVLPALHRFQPEMIFVASGFDASAMDPLGHMMLSSKDFHRMTDAIRMASDTLCPGRLIFTHEGGYSAAHVPYCGLAVLEALSGHTTGILDPFEEHIAHYGGQSLQPHQADAIAEVARLHKLNPKRE